MLGPAQRHWRRAKFLGRFRLFFRYSSQARIIIYAWVNDEKTQRKAGARTDPYAVFGALLRKANPPDGWDALMKEATAHKAAQPLEQAATGGQANAFLPASIRRK
jgi:toxin YhaV